MAWWQARQCDALAGRPAALRQLAMYQGWSNAAAMHRTLARSGCSPRLRSSCPFRASGSQRMRTP